MATPQPSAEAVQDSAIEQFREEFDKLQRALKKSVSTEKALITKCRELKAELVEKTTKLQWAAKMKAEDTRTIAALRKEVQTAWTAADTAQEKELAAQKVVKQLKDEMVSLRAQINELNKTLARMSEDMDQPAHSRLDQSITTGPDGKSAFEQWKTSKGLFTPDTSHKPGVPRLSATATSGSISGRRSAPSSVTPLDTSLGKRLPSGPSRLTSPMPREIAASPVVTQGSLGPELTHSWSDTLDANGESLLWAPATGRSAPTTPMLAASASVPAHLMRLPRLQTES